MIEPSDRQTPFWSTGRRRDTPDLVSDELQRRATLVFLAALVGIGAGVVSMIVAGPEGVLSWLGFLVLGVALVLVLARYFELGVVAFLGICWIAIGTPTVARGGSGEAQHLKLSQLGLIALLAVWGLRVFFRQRLGLYRAPVNTPILVYLTICIWSTINGLLFPNSYVLANGPKQFIQVNLLEVLIRILGLGAVLLIGNTLQGRSLKAACVAVVLPGVLTFTGLLPFIPASAYLAFPQILAMAVLAAIALTGEETRPWLRVVCGALAVAIVGCYFLKGTEWVSGWAGALLAMGLICWTARRRLFWIGVGVIALLVLVNISYFYRTVYKSNFYGSGPTRDISRAGHMGTFTNDRTRMLGAAIRYADSFPLGIGLGNYRSYNQYFGRVDVWNTTTFTSAHGTYAQTLTETGWPGLLAFLWLLYTSAGMLRRYWRALPPGWGKTFMLGAYGGCVGVFCAAFNGDYLFPTYHNGGMQSFGACVYTWFVVGLGIAIARHYGLVWNELIGKKAAKRYSVVAPVYNHGPHAVLPAAPPPEPQG